MLYLLHFETPYRHARHYLGYTESRASLRQRLKAHQRGQGARLMEVVRDAGIGFALARTMPGRPPPGALPEADEVFPAPLPDLSGEGAVRHLERGGENAADRGGAGGPVDLPA